MATKFGQLVIGPPGSGKTTYCNAMAEFLKSLGRKVAIINLDPANDVLPYEPSIDCSQLVSLGDVMDTLHLGPNGGLIYCMEYLEENFDWLVTELSKYSQHYLLFDCPGQVELYTHHNAVSSIAEKLQKTGIRLSAVHLVDSYYCSDPSKFISVLLTSLSTMLKVGLPHINILSKGDLIERYGKLHFHLNYYTEVLNLEYLVETLADDPFMSKYKKLTKAITGIVEDYSLVSFIPINIHEKNSMMNVLQAVDKANGYVFGQGEERNIQAMLSCAMGADFEYFKTADIQEKFIDSSSTLTS